jgi:hypothetical protein
MKSPLSAGRYARNVATTMIAEGPSWRAILVRRFTNLSGKSALRRRAPRGGGLAKTKNAYPLRDSLEQIGLFPHEPAQHGQFMEPCLPESPSALGVLLPLLFD